MLLLRGETDLSAAHKHWAWHKGKPPMYHLRMNGHAREGMESRGATGSEGGREGNIGRYVRQESEEERVCMNERAGITTSHINTAG